MNPLLHEAAKAALHSPDAEVRDRILLAIQALEQAPQNIETCQAALANNQTLAECLQIDPEQFEQYRQLAADLCDQGNFLLALPLAVYCATYKSDDPQHSFLAGACLQRLGQPAAAAHFYRVALQLDEADAASAYRLGECLEAVGQPEDASHLYRWTIELARGDFALRTLQEMAQNRISKLSTTPRP
jgi:tetratricopeptide (TPR) repeat protein